MRGLGRHIWGETSSSSCTGWGKETIGNKVTPPGQGSLGTRSNTSPEEMNKTRRNFCRGAEEEGAIGGNMAAGTSPRGKLRRKNLSKLIKARKTLKARDGVLMAAIRRCHTELAKKKSLRDVEARKNEVEVAWREY